MKYLELPEERLIFDRFKAIAWSLLFTWAIQVKLRIFSGIFCSKFVSYERGFIQPAMMIAMYA